MLLAKISLTLSRHPSLSSIAPGRSSRLHYTRMLRAVLNKSWRQHPTKQRHSNTWNDLILTCKRNFKNIRFGYGSQVIKRPWVTLSMMTFTWVLGKFRVFQHNTPLVSWSSLWLITPRPSNGNGIQTVYVLNWIVWNRTVFTFKCVS